MGCVDQHQIAGVLIGLVQTKLRVDVLWLVASSVLSVLSTQADFRLLSVAHVVDARSRCEC
jgi:hypothetical protein